MLYHCACHCVYHRCITVINRAPRSGEKHVYHSLHHCACHCVYYTCITVLEKSPAQRRNKCVSLSASLCMSLCVLHIYQRDKKKQQEGSRTFSGGGAGAAAAGVHICGTGMPSRSFQPFSSRTHLLRSISRLGRLLRRSTPQTSTSRMLRDYRCS